MSRGFDGRDQRVCRIVYCGASESGKTTNLEALERALPPHAGGKLIRLATESDRTMYFDLLSIEARGARPRIELFSVPGQNFYLPARRRVLREADGIVFVVDSRSSRLEANVEALGDVVAAFQDAGRDLESIPAVLQLNKRDEPTALGRAELLAALGLPDEAFVEAVAHAGSGVLETLRLIVRRTLAGVPQLETAF